MVITAESEKPRKSIIFDWFFTKIKYDFLLIDPLFLVLQFGISFKPLFKKSRVRFPVSTQVLLSWLDSLIEEGA